jgi:hypothetical protein
MIVRDKYAGGPDSSPTQQLCGRQPHPHVSGNSVTILSAPLCTCVDDSKSGLEGQCRSNQEICAPLDDSISLLSTSLSISLLSTSLSISFICAPCPVTVWMTSRTPSQQLCRRSCSVFSKLHIVQDARRKSTKYVTYILALRRSNSSAAFHLKPSHDKPKQTSTFLYSQHGSDFEPAYSLRHPDPDQQASKNRYAAALYNAFNPDVLYAEVLLLPEWTTPTYTADQIKLNGGVPPAPEPILPSEFIIQLYNPDQQVVVRQKPGSFTSAPSWDFEMPQQSFRAPSSSTLDRTQNDPAALENTPKIGFKWKKDNKLSKDLACFLSGRSLDPDGSRKKHKEPDITVAIFKGLKEITLYEPNLQRVDLEDMKGFEVVLLLGAVVIRDVYFGHIKEAFNIGSTRRLSQPTSPGTAGLLGPSHSDSTRPHPPARDPRLPPTDARTQWEIDAETALLKRQASAEKKERKRQEKREQEQIRKLLEEEERENRRKQAEVDRETERLRRLYGQEDASARPPLPQRPSSYQPSAPGYPQPQFHQPQGYYPNSNAWPGPSINPYATPGAQPGPGGYLSPTSPQQHRVKPKSSFFGFRRGNDDDNGNGNDRLQKKRSAVF